MIYVGVRGPVFFIAIRNFIEFCISLQKFRSRYGSVSSANIRGKLCKISLTKL